MAINKVIDRNNNVLIDLTNDTVSSGKVLAGAKFHGPDGKEYEGRLEANDLDTLRYNFIDFDGTLLYSFSDEELDALTSMPAGPDHTDDNLTFQDWNWDLEDLKAWDRTRPDRPIVGANLITTDGKTYIYFKIVKDNSSFLFSGTPTGFTTIDWGDGSGVQTTFSISHKYAKKGDYIITLEPDLSATESIFKHGTSYSSTSVTGNNTIYRIRLGKNLKLNSLSFDYLYWLEDINIPINEEETSWIRSSGQFFGYKVAKAFVIPKNIESITGSSSYGCFSISDQNGTFSKEFYLSINGKLRTVDYLIKGFAGKKIVIPDGLTGRVFTGNYYPYLEELYIPGGITVNELKRNKTKYLDLSRSTQTSLNSAAFEYSYHLREVILPPNLTSIPSSCFSGCTNLKRIKIPESVTSIGSTAFDKCLDLEIDLSEQTKVVTLTSSIITVGSAGGDKTYNLRILVPLALLDQYKTASYWSNYADYMVGV